MRKLFFLAGLVGSTPAFAQEEPETCTETVNVPCPSATEADADTDTTAADDTDVEEMVILTLPVLHHKIDAEAKESQEARDELEKLVDQARRAAHTASLELEKLWVLVDNKCPAGSSADCATGLRQRMLVLGAKLVELDKLVKGYSSSISGNTATGATNKKTAKKNADDIMLIEEAIKMINFDITTMNNSIARLNQRVSSVEERQFGLTIGLTAEGMLRPRVPGNGNFHGAAPYGASTGLNVSLFWETKTAGVELTGDGGVNTDRGFSGGVGARAYGRATDNLDIGGGLGLHVDTADHWLETGPAANFVGLRIEGLVRLRTYDSSVGAGVAIGPYVDLGQVTSDRAAVAAQGGLKITVGSRFTP